MSTPSVGDVLEVKMYTWQPPQLGVNVRHYRVGAVAGLITLTQIASSLDSIQATLYLPLLSSTAEYYGTQVSNITVLPMPVPAQVNANTAIGTAGSTPLPGQVSGIGTVLTDVAGRSGRGRMYASFPDNVSNANGPPAHPTPLYLVNLEVLMNTIYSSRTITFGAVSATLIPVIYHRVTRTTTDVASQRVNASWATQRRRGDYGKPNVLPF